MNQRFLPWVVLPALVTLGISWLMPVVGGYFGFRLKRSGLGPESGLRAALTPVGCLVAMFGMFFGMMAYFQANPPGNKGTHYEKIAPFAPEMSAWLRAHILSLAQVGMWIPMTVFFGSLVGALVALIAPRRS